MTNRKTWARDALISLLLAAGYMLIFAYNNTPLGAAIGSDNAMYLTMGTALAKGYAPYTEIFDHKGPLLFLLQMLPQAVSGGYSLTAVFIQETLVLFACLMMMRAIAKEAGCLPVGGAARLYGDDLRVHGRRQPDGGICESAGNLRDLPLYSLFRQRRAGGQALPSGDGHGRLRDGGVYASRKQYASHCGAGAGACRRAADHAAIRSAGSMRGRICDGHAGGHGSDCAVAGGKGCASRSVVWRNHSQHDVCGERNGRPICVALYDELRTHGDCAGGVLLPRRRSDLQKKASDDAGGGDAGGCRSRRTGGVPFQKILHPLSDAGRTAGGDGRG